MIPERGRDSLPAIPAKTLLEVLRGLLMIWGAISLIGVAILGGFIAFKTGPGNRAKAEHATVSDVGYVLNWAGLGAGRIEKVVHSYESARAMTGDHLDAYQILIRRIDPAELAAKGEDPRLWHRGDQLSPVLVAALEFIRPSLGSAEIPWFPRAEELKSENVFVYPWSIDFRADRPRSAQLIFVRPADRTVFYISTKI